MAGDQTYRGAPQRLDVLPHDAPPFPWVDCWFVWSRTVGDARIRENTLVYVRWEAFAEPVCLFVIETRRASADEVFQAICTWALGYEKGRASRSQ